MIPDPPGEPVELLARLAVALGIGLLAGLERGWKLRNEADRGRAAGFRTFAIAGLSGGVAAALAGSLGGLVFAAVFIGFAAVFGAFHWMEARADKDVSATSAIAGLATFALGGLAVAGDLRAAAAAAVAMTVLLALRDPLHRWVASLRWEEIRAVLVLLAMTCLLLPVLPDRAIDPWGAVNPFEIWLLAILIAAISFGGYVAIRLFGERTGLVLTALAGGLASSTATTLSLARLARSRPAASRIAGAGILLAGVVMVIRVGLVATILNPSLALWLLMPLAAGGLAMAAVGGVVLVLSRDGAGADVTVNNPLDAVAAIRMAALIAVISLAAVLAREYSGAAAAFAVAALSGLADVDAVTLAMARIDAAVMAPRTAAAAILVAVAVNTVVKTVISNVIAGRTAGLVTSLGGAAGLAGGTSAFYLSGG
ncbi:MAG: MgtC/SapB family protein [Glycocaulis sp.]